MSSHNPAKAQRIRDRIGIVKQGRLIREQSICKDSRLGSTTFKVTFVKPSDSQLCKAARELKFVSQAW